MWLQTLLRDLHTLLLIPLTMTVGAPNTSDKHFPNTIEHWWKIPAREAVVDALCDLALTHSYILTYVSVYDNILILYLQEYKFEFVTGLH